MSERERLAELLADAILAARRARPAPLDDEDLVHAYDAVILIGPYLRADVTAEERATITSDIVACVARPLRLLLADRRAQLDAAVARERERILALMGHASPCKGSDAPCVHSVWSVCLEVAIRQGLRP